MERCDDMKLFFHADLESGLEECRRTKGAVLADVREADEYRSGHIPGAVHLPLSGMETLEMDRETPRFLYCLRGMRSRRAARTLKKRGYRHVKSIGGITEYTGKLETGGNRN